MRNNGHRLTFSNSRSAWDSWYRAGTEKQLQDTVDYDVNALWSMLKHRYGIEMGKNGAIQIDIKDGKIDFIGYCEK